MFTKAIVKTPCKNLASGLSSAGLGKPDYNLALKQHKLYIDALRICGLEVTILPPDDQYPDSTFVEDIAIFTPYCVVITQPGAVSRKGEIAGLREILSLFNKTIEEIQPPGTLDGGDVLMIGSHYFIGLSERTNMEGARQLIRILEKHGMNGSTVSLKNVLHLKSGVAYLGNNTLAAAGEFTSKPEFNRFNIVKIDDDENYAANCIRINKNVLVPEGFPKTVKMIEQAGFTTLAVDVSEFRKLDGGLSCLSLRF
jgi:dimethylargininase